MAVKGNSNEEKHRLEPSRYARVLRFWRSPGVRNGVGGHVRYASSNSDLAISFGGISLVKTGKITAQSEGLNLAIASNNSQASASGIGIGNVAIATNNSYAASGGLLLNTAIADNNSTAFAALGLETGNTALARKGAPLTVPARASAPSKQPITVPPGRSGASTTSPQTTAAPLK